MAGDGLAAGTPAMALLARVGLSTGTVQAPGAVRRATGGEDHSDPGAVREVDHQGKCLYWLIRAGCCLTLYVVFKFYVDCMTSR